MQIRRRGIRPDRFIAPPPYVPNWTHVQGTGGNPVGGFTTGFSIATNAPLTAGNLVIVGCETYQAGRTIAISDTQSNTWHGPYIETIGSVQGYVWYSVLTTGGTLTVNFVVTGGTVLASTAIDEYSIAPGGVVAIDGTPAESNAATATTITSPTIAITGANLVYGLVGGDGNNYVFTPTNGANARYTNSGPSGAGAAMQAQDQLGVTASPVSIGATAVAAHNLTAICLAFNAAVPAMLVKPSTVPVGHAGNITLTLTGSNTSWFAGTTTFTATGVSGVSLVSQTIVTPTSATLVISSTSSTGSLTISDGTNTAVVAIKTPSMTSSPLEIGELTPTTITVVGYNTIWTQENPSTLFTVSGIAGAIVSSLVVTSDVLATFTLGSETSIGSGAILDNSTGATSPVTIFAATPGIAVSPSVFPAGTSNLASNWAISFPFVVTGTHTHWTAGTPGTPTFTVAGVAGVVIVSQTITSATSATLTLTSGSATGTLTISDGVFTTTIQVIAASTVSNAYVSRNGQTAYFLTSGCASVFESSPSTLINYAVPAATVTAGGSGYVSPTAAIAGGVSLGLTAGGSGYKTPPKVTLTGGGGTGASATANISSGIQLAVANGGSGYTTPPSVTISGGGGSGASATAVLFSGISIAITSGGSGYTQAPTVTISGGIGTLASATAEIFFGQVVRLVVTPGQGYIGGATPTVTFSAPSSGTTATAVATVPTTSFVNGFVLAPGSGYLGGPVPSVTLAGGGGSGASAVATIPTGAVSGFNVVPGSGYTSPPTVTIVGGGGLYATAEASIVSNGGTGCMFGTPVVTGGVIQQIPVIAPGSGYTSAPPITITDLAGTGASATSVLGGPPLAIAGVNANPTISVNGTPVATAVYVNQIAISNAGSGYPAAPAVTFSGGGPFVTPAATATTSYGPNGTLTINLLSGGKNYTATPTLSIAAGLGTGATAAANWTSAGGNSTINTLVMTNGGSGYLPVTVSGGSGSGVTAYPLVTTAGQVALTLTSGGSGYTSPPTVSANGGGGTNFAAQAVIANGSVVGFIVTNPGKNYTSTPTVTFSGGYPTVAATATASYAAGQIYAIQVVSTGSGYVVGDTVSVTIGAPASGTTATAAGILGPVWSAINSDWPFVPYQMLCGGIQSIVVQKGGANYVTPVVTLTGGGGSGVVLGTPVLANGVIVSIPITSAGINSTEANGLLVADSTGSGSGCAGYVTTANSGVATVVVEAGGKNYSTSGTLTAGYATYNGVGSGEVLGTPVLANGVLQSIPVTSIGSGYTSPPTITITDSGGSGSGAVAVAIMSGPAPTDIVTYSAPAGWLNTVGPVSQLTPLPSGPVPGATNVRMFNYAGQIEPWFSQVPRDLALGAGTGAPNSNTSGFTKQQNWLKSLGGTWTGAVAPVVTITRAGGDTTGVLASSVAVVNSSGQVTGIRLISGGVAYTAAPTISIAAPASGGTTATGWTASISGGMVTAISGGTGGSGYAGATYDLHPIAINGTTYPGNFSTGGLPTAWIQVAVDNKSSGVDSTTIPDLSGIWTLVADDSSRFSPMQVNLYAYNAAHVETLVPPVAGYPTTGTLLGGVHVGRTWQWNVPRTGSALNICLSVSGPSTGVSAPYTLSNEFLAAPVRGTGAAQVVNRAKPYAPNPNLISALSPSGGPYPAYIRCSSFGAWQTGAQGFSNAVDVSDLQSPTDFSYAGTGNLTAIGVAIRQYQISPTASSAGNPYPGYQSPYIWTNQNYPGANAVAGGPSPYAWQPPGNAVSNNVDWLQASGTSFATVAAEILTAQPHGFKTGQLVAWSVPGSDPSYAAISTVPVWDQSANSGAGGTVPVNFAGFSGAVWVTGPNSFAIPLTNLKSVGAGPIVYNVNATVSANFAITTPVPSGGGSLPYEVLASLVAAIPGCGMHVLIPLLGTDAYYTAVATTIRDYLPPNRNVIPEFTDEHWNSGYPHFGILFLLSSLSSTGSTAIRMHAQQDLWAVRQAQIHQIFINVFNQRDINGNTNRGGSIVRAFGSQDGNHSVTIDMMQVANAYNATNPAVPVRIDAILLAPYLDTQQDVSIANAVAGSYSNFPGSVQYQSRNPWTMGMYLDLWRHYAQYSISHVNTGLIHTSNLSLYTPVTGQSAPIYIVGYEGTPQAVIPTGVTRTNFLMRAYMAHDFSYHPYYYDTMIGFYNGLTRYGMSIHQCNEWCTARSDGGPSTVIYGVDDKYKTILYNYVTWEGQSWGKGDGTLDGNGNPTTNLLFNGTGAAQDLGNVSPKAQAWRDWVQAANSPPYVPPISPMVGHQRRRRWYSGLSRGRL